MIRFWDKWNTFLQYVKYIFCSKHINGHGIHSPMVYEFASKVLFRGSKKTAYSQFKPLLKQLHSDNRQLKIIEYGGGSMAFRDKKRSVSELLKHSSVQGKYRRLLYRITNYYKPGKILEIGTSIGISTLYMAKGYSGASIDTIEGNSSLIDIAKENFRLLDIQNIVCHHGVFNEKLVDLLDKYKQFDLVFIDGNHTYEATIEHYKTIRPHVNHGLIIFDDIYWSKEMQRAWEHIKSCETCCVDLFQFGIVFVKDLLTPRQYRIRF